MEYDITNTVVALLIGVGLGLGLVALYVWRIMSRFEQEIDLHIRNAVKEVEKALLPVIVEQDGDEIFVYSEKDRQFLVQGRTAGELRERLDQRFPDRIAYLAGGDENLVQRLQSELKMLKEQEKSEVSHSV
jgi:hypothetical protein